MPLDDKVVEVSISLREAGFHSEADELIRIAAGSPSPVDLSEAADALGSAAQDMGVSAPNERVEPGSGKDRYISMIGVGFQFVDSYVPELLRAIRKTSRRAVEYSPKKSVEMHRLVFKVS